MVLKFLVLLLPLCQCFIVDISLVGKDESRNLKLVCAPPSANLNVKTGGYEVLWHGSQFGASERDKLSQIVALQTDDLVPNISINSSKLHHCYLLASRDLLDGLPRQNKRISRDSSDSIAAENGDCPPGYRINQDRCFPCFPGSYTSGQQSECFLCPKNFYTDRKASDSCWPCPAGKKTLAEGADSEESCVELDASGHVVPREEPPWILIYCLVGLILACVWIAIFLMLLRYWKEMKGDDGNQGGKVERRKDWRERWPLLLSPLRRKPTAGSNETDDPEYGDIDEGALYEEPRKGPHSPQYLDLEAPALPPRPKKRRHSSVDDVRPMEDQYEVPIRKTDVGPTSGEEELYEEPIRKRSEVPPPKNRQHAVSQTSSEEDPLAIAPTTTSSELRQTAGQSEEEPVYDEIHSPPQPNPFVRPSGSEGGVPKPLPKADSAGFQPTRAAAPERESRRRADESNPEGDENATR